MTGTDVATTGSSAEVQSFSLGGEPSELEVWANDLRNAYAIAVRLVETSFVPDSYKGKPSEAAAAVMTGQELHLSPLASLRSIDIINGVPGMRAIALRALVQSNGHEIWVEESTATRAVVKGRRKGSDKVETSAWTIERATQLGLAAKDQWRKQPIAMLLARATSECARLVAADVLLGIPYSIEELEDLNREETAALGGDAAPKAVRRTAKRTALPAARVAEPPLDGEEPATGAAAASQRGAAKREEEPAVDAATGEVDGEAADAARMDEIAREEEEEEARIELENRLWREEQERDAAKAGSFESAPADLVEPPIDWEPPLEDGAR